MSSPQPPNQPPRDNPIGDAADRTQVVRPGQGSDEGPERTQAMQPGQPAPQQPSGGADSTQVVRPAQPPQQQPPPGGFNPGGQQQGGFNQGGQQQGGFNPNPPGGQQGGFNPGGQQQGGFNPNPPSGQQGGFNPNPPGGQQGGFNPAGQQGGFNPNPQGPRSGGFSPGGPGGPPQGGFNPGGGYPGGQQGGFSPGGGPSGFGPAANDNDKMVAMGAGGSAIGIGLIVLILNLASIGYVFDASAFVGLLAILVVLLAAGLIGGGVLIFMRNKLGPLLAGGCGAAIGGLALINVIAITSITGVFSGGTLVGLLLVAIPTVLAFMPGTKRYANSGAAPPGFGQQQGGYGRPF